MEKSNGTIYCMRRTSDSTTVTHHEVMTSKLKNNDTHTHTYTHTHTHTVQLSESVAE